MRVRGRFLHLIHDKIRESFEFKEEGRMSVEAWKASVCAAMEILESDNATIEQRMTTIALLTELIEMADDLPAKPL